VPASLSERERLEAIGPPDPEEFVRAAVAEAVAQGHGAEAGEADHAAELETWARRMTYAADAVAAGEFPAAPSGEEVLPMPRPIRQAVFRALVKTALKDVYAYFFGGQGDSIRQRLSQALEGIDGAAVVVAHSLGTVVAYDVLRARDGMPTVPLLVTLGSPLGVQEIEDDVAQPLQVPGQTRRWLNACDGRDVVALDATLRDEYPPADRLRDAVVSNDSENHHDIGPYLRAAVVRSAVHAAAGLGERASEQKPPARSQSDEKGQEDSMGTPPPEDPLQTPITNGVPHESIEDGRVVEPEVGDVAALEPDEDGTEPVAAPQEAEMVPTAPPTDLPDIGAASFGGAVAAAPVPSRGVFFTRRPPGALETVHGADNRVQITDTQHYPWSAVASLLITARDGSQWLGTGWFIGPRTLLTAGHCVYITNSPVAARNGWVLSIQVLPGRNGTVLPYGSATATTFWTVRGWAENGDENYDYGAIILPGALSTNTDVGTFGFAVLPDDELTARVLNVVGYPGDKPAGTVWYDRHKAASVSPSKVFYDVDTAGGQSGAPVYVIEGDRRIGVAVHAYGGATTNSGTRISPAVFDNVQAWRQ
jgi:V8-like Glu-specific endopeptidase